MTAAGTLPLLLSALQAAEFIGVSRSTFNDWVKRGRIPEECKHDDGYGGWPRYSRVQLERWAAKELGVAS